MSDEVVKVALLEQKFADFVGIVNKLDDAIQKLSEVNTNLIKMLAVHDEKIEQCNKADNLLIKMIGDIEEDTEKEIKKITDKIEILDEKVSEVSKIKWMTVGCGVFLAILTTAFSTLASGWWTPSEMQVQHEGHTHQQTVAPDTK